MRQELTAAVVGQKLVRQCTRHGVDPMAALEPRHKPLRVAAAAVWAADNAVSLEDLRTVARAFRVDWRDLIEPVLEMAQLHRIARSVPGMFTYFEAGKTTSYTVGPEADAYIIHSFGHAA